jgi:nucleoside-diphosphate-sugar epimerase
MKVLITGAAGFIGSQVVRIALQEGHEVVGVVYPGTQCSSLQGLENVLTTTYCDLNNDAAARELVKRARPELAVHLAWYVEPGKFWSSPQNLDCLAMTAKLACHLKAAGCRRIVAVGTCAEYAWGEGILNEETTPLRPRTLYGVCKDSARRFLEEFSHAFSMEMAWVRFFLLYGPGEPAARLVPSVILALLQDEPIACTTGEQVRDFLHVEDAANALWLVAKSPLCGSVNIGSGDGVAVRSIVETIARLLGKPELIRWGAISGKPEDPPTLVADVAKLRQATGWKPNWQLEEGLRQTIFWWRNQIQHGVGTHP